MDGISTLSPLTALHPAYSVMVLLGFAVMFAFPITRDIRSANDRRSYYLIQVVTLLGALLGAKLAVVMGDALWPLRPFDDWAALLLSGRSIIGALVLGFIVAEVCKPIMRYQLPPNDRFAVALPVSIAIGRVGCHLVGCCRGISVDSPLAVRYADGVARHPIAIYEIGFHLMMALLLLRLYRSGWLRGRLFALYLAAYGGFRLLSEFLRITEKAFAGLSAYQWFALAAVILGLLTIYLRTLVSAASRTREVTP